MCMCGGGEGKNGEAKKEGEVRREGMIASSIYVLGTKREKETRDQREMKKRKARADECR